MAFVTECLRWAAREKAGSWLHCHLSQVSPEPAAASLENSVSPMGAMWLCFLAQGSRFSSGCSNSKDVAHTCLSPLHYGAKEPVVPASGTQLPVFIGLEKVKDVEGRITQDHPDKLLWASSYISPSGNGTGFQLAKGRQSKTRGCSLCLCEEATRRGSSCLYLCRSTMVLGMLLGFGSSA